jgi:hypothetical protein
MKQLRIVVLSQLMVFLCSLLSAGQQGTVNVLPPATISGSGTTNYIPLWTSSTALGNSHIYQSGGNTGIGTTSPQYALDVSGHINSSSGYVLGETLVLTMPGGVTYGNLALGYSTLALNTSGQENTAAGSGALAYNTTGYSNTALGSSTLENNTSGAQNTAGGAYALHSNTTGVNNTADGFEALYQNNVGQYNTAAGFDALYSNTNGDGNTAMGYDALVEHVGSYNVVLGYQALDSNTTGDNNIAIGYLAGNDAPPTSSYNIEIGSTGTTSDIGTIRIGSVGTQSSFFVAGVRGVATAENNAVPVVIDSNGQLGTVSSSRRFKTDIRDMGDASGDLMRLRPVTFRYQKPFADGSQPIQYGLIAEEVAEVFPDLVARSADGQIETVKYQLLDPLLLNEVQRQQAEIRALQEQLNQIETAVAQTVAEGHAR